MIVILTQTFGGNGGLAERVRMRLGLLEPLTMRWIYLFGRGCLLATVNLNGREPYDSTVINGALEKLAGMRISAYVMPEEGKLMRAAAGFGIEQPKGRPHPAFLEDILERRLPVKKSPPSDTSVMIWAENEKQLSLSVTALLGRARLIGVHASFDASCFFENVREVFGLPVISYNGDEYLENASLYLAYAPPHCAAIERRGRSPVVCFYKNAPRGEGLYGDARYYLRDAEFLGLPPDIDIESLSAAMVAEGVVGPGQAVLTELLQ